MRDGAGYFLNPAGSSQRRYEALRAYFTEGMPAAEVADRFGYSTASVHQMATLLRKGKLALFTGPGRARKGRARPPGSCAPGCWNCGRPGIRSPRSLPRSPAGLPVSAQTAWQILDAEGIPRLPRRDEGRRGPPARLAPVQAAKLPGWPAGNTALGCDHAGLLLLLFPAMAQVDLPRLVRAAGYPSTRALSSWQSVGTLLLAKCARKPRVHHIGSLTDDEGLAFTLGLTALPKATHLGTYSWRAHRDSNQKLLAGLVAALRPLGLATGEAGFNCDFHAIRRHGDDTVLEKHYVPRRSQRTRAVLTFFAQDHASAEMAYANADITKAEQAAEIIAFADYWQQAPAPTLGCWSSTPS